MEVSVALIFRRVFWWRLSASRRGNLRWESLGKSPSSSGSTPEIFSRRGTTGTRIDQQTAALSDAAEIVNRSFPTLEPSGRFINAISPVVIPNRQSLFWRIM
ncbi:MAG: hypothetical protein ACRDN7_08395, partial [Rubrobacter sp.]